MYSYFQALALHALGNYQAARAVLLSLANFAKHQMEKEPKIDYFATSLPNLLLFDDDLGKRNRIESLLLSALASHGLGDEEAAMSQLEQVIDEDRNHLIAAETLSWIKQKHNAVPEGHEADPS
jgi:hypothetical protein